MNKKVQLVGHLQKFANPYISLYQEVGTGALFLLLCMGSSSASRECMIQEVSAQAVKDYMDGNAHLKQLFTRDGAHLCRLISATGDVYQDTQSLDNPAQHIKVADVFNEDWCEDELTLSIFLDEKLEPAGV